MSEKGMTSSRIYKAGEFAKLLGVTVKTLQRWDRVGILTAHRTVTNRRYYTDEDLATCLNGHFNTSRNEVE